MFQLCCASPLLAREAPCGQLTHVNARLSKRCALPQDGNATPAACLAKTTSTDTTSTLRTTNISPSIIVKQGEEGEASNGKGKNAFFPYLDWVSLVVKIDFAIKPKKGRKKERKKNTCRCSRAFFFFFFAPSN